MSSSSKPVLLNATAACTPTTKITSTTTITRAARTRTRTGSRKAREAQVSKSRVWGGQFWRAAIGGTVCAGMMAIRILSVWTPIVSHMHWALGTVDARVSVWLIHVYSIGSGYALASGKQLRWRLYGLWSLSYALIAFLLLFYYYYYYLFIFGWPIIGGVPRKHKSNFCRDPSFFIIIKIMFFFLSFLLGIIFWVSFFSDLCYTWRVFFLPILWYR